MNTDTVYSEYSYFRNIIVQKERAQTLNKSEQHDPYRISVHYVSTACIFDIQS